LLNKNIEFYIREDQWHRSGAHQSGIAQKQLHLQSQPMESMKKGLVINDFISVLKLNQGCDDPNEIIS
jgi:hypothetical protein